jgi:hypothetical protein
MRREHQNFKILRVLGIKSRNRNNTPNSHRVLKLIKPLFVFWQFRKVAQAIRILPRLSHLLENIHLLSSLVECLHSIQLTKHQPRLQAIIQPKSARFTISLLKKKYLPKRFLTGILVKCIGQICNFWRFPR